MACINTRQSFVQDTKQMELISAQQKPESPAVTLQKPESPAVTLTWHVSKYKIHKLHQMYIPQKGCLPKWYK